MTEVKFSVNNLEKDLGKAMRAKEVAQYLGLDEKTVRQYHRELGGMRLGRRILFFERRIIDAIQNRTEVESPSAKEWKPTRESLPDQEGGAGVGSRDEAKTRRRVERGDYPFDLLA